MMATCFTAAAEYFVSVCLLFLSRSVSILHVYGAAVISPSPRVEVCHVDDSQQTLKVMCTITNTTVTYLRWSLEFISESETAVTSTITSGMIVDDTQVVDSTVFIFRRSSERGVVPLVSTMTVSPVQGKLNGSRISCGEGRGDDPATLANTTVYIVGNNPNYYNPSLSEYDIVEEHFEIDRVTIILWWTGELVHPLVAYHVHVSPTSEVTTDILNKRANITLQYNTLYVARVVASFCGQSNATVNIELNYGMCRELLSISGNDSYLVATGQTTPPLLEGSVVNFSRSSGYELSGPATATCMSDGNWVPDIGNVKCKELPANCPPPPSLTNGYLLPYTSTLEGANITYICGGVPIVATCTDMGKWEPNIRDVCSLHHSTTGSALLSQDGKIAVGSLLTLSVVCSVLFFIFGIVCSHFCFKQKRCVETTLPPLQESTAVVSGPLYEDIQAMRNEAVEVELETNVAYGPAEN